MKDALPSTVTQRAQADGGSIILGLQHLELRSPWRPRQGTREAKVAYWLSNVSASNSHVTFTYSLLARTRNVALLACKVSGNVQKVDFWQPVQTSLPR